MRLLPRPERIRQATDRKPARPFRARRHGHRDRRRRGIRGQVRNGVQRGRTRPDLDAAKGKWFVTASRSASSTGVSNCTAATATWRSTQLRTHNVDTRVQTIYGGTTEIMKEIIGRDIAR